MTDFLDEKRQEITDRLKELKPLVDEYNRLEAAASALAGVGGSRPLSCRDSHYHAAVDPDARAARQHRAPRKQPPPGAAAKPRRQKTRSPAQRQTGRPPKRRAGRRKGSGTRAAEARAFVQGQPGITIPELAAKMGIKQNYLYRVLPGLQQENKVEKKGRGWYPKG